MSVIRTLTAGPSAIFLISEALIAVVISAYLLLWPIYWFPQLMLSNVGEMLVYLLLLTYRVYVWITPILLVVYVGVLLQRAYLKWIEYPISTPARIWRPAMHAVLYPVAVYFVFVSFIGLAFEADYAYLRCFEFINGPDTNHAREAFKKKLGCYPPDHVYDIYNRDGLSQDILRFKTRDPRFIADIIRRLDVTVVLKHDRKVSIYEESRQKDELDNFAGGNFPTCPLTFDNWPASGIRHVLEFDPDTHEVVYRIMDY